MTIVTAQLVSASALPDEILSLRVGAETYIIVVKAHQGPNFPRKELEIFTVSQVIAAQSGPYFFNVTPLRVEILDRGFRLVSAIALSTTTVRLYYNTAALSVLTIYQIDVNLATRVATSPELTLTFAGLDPFVMDARTGSAASRIYLVYVNASGINAYRKSTDLGITWSDEVQIDDAGMLDHRYVEANFNDPLTLKESVQVMQRRDL